MEIITKFRSTNGTFFPSTWSIKAFFHPPPSWMPNLFNFPSNFWIFKVVFVHFRIPITFSVRSSMKKTAALSATELSNMIHINHRVGKVIDLNPSRIQTKEVTSMEECNILFLEQSLWLYEQGGPIPPTEQNIWNTGYVLYVCLQRQVECILECER